MRPRGRAGMTLFELMVSMGILVLIGLGAIRAFEASVSFQTTVLPRLDDADRARRIETKIAAYLRTAYLSAGIGGTAATYFTGAATGQSAWNSGLGDIADSLTFTSLGMNPSSVYLEAVDEFPNLNERFGPQGGMLEVAFEPVAVGDAGSATGPFLRTQRPADGDPTQGGYESVVDADLAGINFEFWDGTTWVPEWDSNTMDTPRLPAAIRVSYALVGEESAVKTFVVRLPLSDVTPDNPAGVSSGGAQ